MQICTISSDLEPMFPRLSHAISPLPSQFFLCPVRHLTAIHTSHPTLCNSSRKTIFTVSGFHVHIRTVFFPSSHIVNQLTAAATLAGSVRPVSLPVYVTRSSFCLVRWSLTSWSFKIISDYDLYLRKPSNDRRWIRPATNISY